MNSVRLTALHDGVERRRLQALYINWFGGNCVAESSIGVRRRLIQSHLPVPLRGRSLNVEGIGWLARNSVTSLRLSRERASVNHDQLGASSPLVGCSRWLDGNVTSRARQITTWPPTYNRSQANSAGQSTCNNCRR